MYLGLALVELEAPVGQHPLDLGEHGLGLLARLHEHADVVRIAGVELSLAFHGLVELHEVHVAHEVGERGAGDGAHAPLLHLAMEGVLAAQQECRQELHELRLPVPDALAQHDDETVGVDAVEVRADIGLHGPMVRVQLAPLDLLEEVRRRQGRTERVERVAEDVVKAVQVPGEIHQQVALVVGVHEDRAALRGSELAQKRHARKRPGVVAVDEVLNVLGALVADEV